MGPAGEKKGSGNVAKITWLILEISQTCEGGLRDDFRGGEAKGCRAARNCGAGNAIFIS